MKKIILVLTFLVLSLFVTQAQEKVYEFPIEGNSSKVLKITVKGDIGKWKIRDQFVWTLTFTNLNFSDANKGYSAAGGEILVLGEKPMVDFNYVKENYPIVVTNVSDQFNLNGIKCEHFAYIGLLKEESRVPPNGDWEITGTVGSYQEIFNFRVPGYPHEISIRINGNGYHEGDTESTQLPQMRQVVLDFVKKLHFSVGEPAGGEAQSSEDVGEIASENEEGEDVPWEVVIGLIGAGGAAALARKLFRKKPVAKSKSREKTTQKQKEEKEQVKYILNLNKENFKISAEKPEILEAVVYKITSKSKRKYPAQIRIINSEKTLQITPNQATGSLSAQLILKDKPQNKGFNITVQAIAEGKEFQKNVRIQTEGEQRITLETLPNNKRSLRPDTYQIITISAQVLDENDKPLPELSEQIRFKPQSDWIDISEPVLEDSVILINMGCTNPNPNKQTSNVPDSVFLTLYMDDVPEGEPPLQHDLEIKLLDCKLDTEIEEATFPVSDEMSEISFDVYIENAGEEKGWNFSGEYRLGIDPTDPLTTIEIQKKGEFRASVILSGPLMKPGEGESVISKTLVISAAQGDEKPLERHLNIMVSQEGLIVKHGVNKNNEIHILADKPFEENLDIALYRFNKQTNQVIADKSGLAEIQFELQNEEAEIINLASVLQPEFEFSGLVTNIPYGRYHFSTKEDIPGTGDVYTLNYLVKADSGDSEKPELFEKNLSIKVKTYGIGKEFPDWVKAYEECKYVINNYVPAGDARNKLHDILELRKMTLGAEGLTELRNRIWKVASNLILAEGAEGYKSVEVWANAITTTLEWTEWAGDIAFNALAAFYLKGMGATAAGMIKAKMIEALNFYIYEPEKGWDVFASRQLDSIMPLLLNTAKGRILSIENIELVVKNNRVLAWTIFISCEFLFNLYQTKSVVEAAKITGRQLAEEFIMRKITTQLHREALKRNYEVITPDEVLNDMMQKVKTVDGEEVIDQKKLLEIMRDPAKVRTIENHGTPKMKEIFIRSRKKIYAEHDARLKEYLSETYHLKPDEIKIDEFRTPGKENSSVNTDRDYRILRKVKGADGNGKWIEVQRDNWLKKSYEIFGDVTGKPDGIDDLEWAEKHQQRGTDRFDAESSKDNSDHVFNPETGEMDINPSNITKVKEGKTTLYDAEETGKMYKTKVDNAINGGSESEAFAQAQKAVKTLKGARKGYESQDLKIKQIPEKLEKAMKIIEDAHVDVNASPDYIQNLNKKLNDLHYSNIQHVAKDMQKSFGELKKFNTKNPADSAFK
ncbi:hypothetical protein [Maribellus maritimus]|uniref:hypothetical protein n=1 Tax=Maribellus maritimus TaxID=2870838 RepID=UPI001EEA486D|nr:hypothetical protein [Maribellus maritimus]MCG6187306.1 hypothetical protein [Maribellus maritimus]